MLTYAMTSVFFSFLLCSVLLILFEFYSIPLSFSWVSFIITNYIKLVPIPIPSLLLQKFICYICVFKWISNSFGDPLRSFIPCPYFLTELCGAPFLFCNKVLLYSFFPCHLVLYYISLFFKRSLISGGYHCSSPEFTKYPSFLSAMPYTYCSSTPYHVTLLHCTENPIYVIPEIKLRHLIPSSYIHWSVSDLYPRIGHRYLNEEIGRKNIIILFWK